MHEEFPIVPGSPHVYWLPVAVGLLLAGVLAMLVITTAGARTSRFIITENHLRLRGDLWGRSIPLAKIQKLRARMVDLDAEPALRPRSRRFGTGLWGYQSGWFRLASGELALVYLTQRRQAVYVPTAAGYALLLSPQQPERFVARLQAAGSGT